MSYKKSLEYVRKRMAQLEEEDRKKKLQEEQANMESKPQEQKVEPMTPQEQRAPDFQVQPVPAGTMSFEQVQALLMAAVREMKKPTEQEQRKIDEQLAKEKRMLEARIEVGKADELRRTAFQKICPHVRWDGDGKPCVQGQLFSDGIWRGFCLRCQKVVREFRPDPSMMTMAGQVNVVSQ